ncbi:hypothetical protein EN35_36980 [Rhodococcus qingshengii]|nr:hypothetical protein EN35_36980 [Rhodococcus qingshengii]
MSPEDTSVAVRHHDQIRVVRADEWCQTVHRLVEDLRHAGCASAFVDLGFAARLGDRAPVRIESERTQTRPRIRDDGARTRRRLASRHRCFVHGFENTCVLRRVFTTGQGRFESIRFADHTPVLCDGVIESERCTRLQSCSRA